MLPDLIDNILIFGLLFSTLVFVLSRFTEKTSLGVLEPIVYIYISIFIVLAETSQYLVFSEYIDLNTTLGRCFFGCAGPLCFFLVASLYRVLIGRSIAKTSIKEEAVESITAKIREYFLSIKRSIGSKIGIVNSTVEMHTKRLDKLESFSEEIVTRMTQIAEIVYNINTTGQQKQGDISTKIPIRSGIFKASRSTYQATSERDRWKSNLSKTDRGQDKSL